MNPDSGSSLPGSRMLDSSYRDLIWTVSALTQHVQQLLESDDQLQNVWLTGEVSNSSRGPTGHLYFTLKDAGAAVSCVMWRTTVSSLLWQPEQGVAVTAHGRISLYAPRGQYQLIVDYVQPSGLGDLHARFEQLRDKLKAEGLFDPARKRRLPPFPRVVGVATSPQAAALRDVLTVLRRRYPLVQVVVAPTLVQGDQAPPQIVAALRSLDARDDVDVVLLVRGGGSLEELWAFNDERVARAVAACRHPVVCGVGHETDVTIADWVADLRAPTPSAAAELAVPDQTELRQRLQVSATQLGAHLGHRLGMAREAIAQQQRALRRLAPRARLEAYRQQIDDLTHRGQRALSHDLTLRRSELGGSVARLAALSPLATLERGYAIVRRGDTGSIVCRVDQVVDGDDLDIQVQDGGFSAVTRKRA